MRVTLLFFLGVLLGCSKSQDMTWDFINRKTHIDFPKAQEVETEDVARMMTNENEMRLFDVREADEYAVSHIDSAENLKTAEEIVAAVPDKSAFIVTYCSVGYRSGKVASELRTLGYGRAFNLKGSIFKWANEGNPVYSGGEATQFVHPFNEKWGVLLHEKLRRYEPPE